MDLVMDLKICKVLEFQVIMLFPILFKVKIKEINFMELISKDLFLKKTIENIIICKRKTFIVSAQRLDKALIHTMSNLINLLAEECSMVLRGIILMTQCQLIVELTYKVQTH